jgi:hypothetical protein
MAPTPRGESLRSVHLGAARNAVSPDSLDRPKTNTALGKVRIPAAWGWKGRMQGLTRGRRLGYRDCFPFFGRARDFSPFERSNLREA